MFEKASVMIMLGNKKDVQIYRLETDKSTQEAICRSFAELSQHMIENRELIKFDGSYKPEEDEVLYIDSFSLDEQILEAVKEPSGVPAFIPNKEEQDNILAVCVGEKVGKTIKIAFQKFRKEQYISAKGLNIFFDKNTFKQDKRYGITISECVDCVWIDGKLRFDSYFIARQIFDLQDYYRIATEKEVETFTNKTILEFEDAEEFKKQTNYRIRKMIAEIADSGVLDKYPASEIKKMAKQQTGVELDVKNKRLIIPQEKEKRKVVLAVLTEGVYKGLFSKETYIANSKRVVKK